MGIQAYSPERSHRAISHCVVTFSSHVSPPRLSRLW